MKHRLIISVILIALICVCVVLNSSALDPSDFTGVWYGAEDGYLYIFEDGLIACTEHYIELQGSDPFSGAYSIAKNKTAVFIIDDDGVGEIVELYLIRSIRGDYLCEAEDGTGKIWFYRNAEAVRE